MEEYLIVDGYNIINNWPNLVDLKDDNLEHARNKLIEILQNYAGFRNIKVIIVFDAHFSHSKVRTSEVENNVEIIYSKKGETADAVIERLIDFLPQRSKVEVATSDWAEQKIVLGKGALRISARELYIRVREVEKKISTKIEKNRNKNKQKGLESYITDDIRKKLEKWRRKS